MSTHVDRGGVKWAYMTELEDYDYRPTAILLLVLCLCLIVGPTRIRLYKNKKTI